MIENKCKKCRREGEKLMLKGERCISPKCAMVKRAYAPGQHGQSFRGKLSEYGKQLREKQKARRIYGISESQFAKYVGLAEKMKGNNAENLMKLLEQRLDNIIFRLCVASSRSQARQMVSHRFFKVNNKIVNIPSFLVSVGDTIEIKNTKDISKANIPSWIEFDAKKNTATIKHLPSREEIDSTFNESLIIEFYSR